MNKFKKLLAEYKNIASEMKVKAELYSRLDWKVRTYITSDEEFNEYKKLWSELFRLNSRAYQIFCEYRQLARTKKYRVLFALGWYVANIHLYLLRRTKILDFSDMLIC